MKKSAESSRTFSDQNKYACYNGMLNVSFAIFFNVLFRAVTISTSLSRYTDEISNWPNEKLGILGLIQLRQFAVAQLYEAVKKKKEGGGARNLHSDYEIEYVVRTFILWN